MNLISVVVEVTDGGSHYDLNFYKEKCRGTDLETCTLKQQEHLTVKDLSQRVDSSSF